MEEAVVLFAARDLRRVVEERGSNEVVLGPFERFRFFTEIGFRNVLFVCGLVYIQLNAGLGSFV